MKVTPTKCFKGNDHDWCIKGTLFPSIDGSPSIKVFWCRFCGCLANFIVDKETGSKTISVTEENIPAVRIPDIFSK